MIKKIIIPVIKCDLRCPKPNFNNKSRHYIRRRRQAVCINSGVIPSRKPNFMLSVKYFICKIFNPIEETWQRHFP